MSSARTACFTRGMEPAFMEKERMPRPSSRGTSFGFPAISPHTETGIRSVTIEYLPSTSTAWTAVCTVTTTPYTCAWNTQGVPDGEYTIRATALNTIGLTATSTGVSTTVANAFTVALTDPGEIQAAFARADELMAEFQVPVVVEIILERVTNIAMGTEIDAVVEFEELAQSPADAPSSIAAMLD